MSPLVPWPRAAVAIIAVCGLAVGVLGIGVHNDIRGTAFDLAITDWIVRNLSGGLLSNALRLADPALVFGLLAMVGAAAALRHRWDITLLAAAAPLAALAVVELILKPVVHRAFLLAASRDTSGPLSFPSGHETGVSSLLAVLALLVLRSGLSVVARVLATLALLAFFVVTSIGLVGRYDHYPTDTIGALGVSVMCVLAAALSLDRAASGLRRRRARTQAAPARVPG